MPDLLSQAIYLIDKWVFAAVIVGPIVAIAILAARVALGGRS
jgi:uncharacterized membrane protein YqhA